MKISHVVYVVLFLIALTAVNIFAPQPPDLSDGDIVTIEEETYMVHQATSYGKVVLIGPGPGSNPNYKTQIVNVGLHKPNQIINKDDSGWKTNATWFYLQ